jgi:hypothetical protein
VSDGLIPPLNAPPAGAAVPGIQPGSSGIDLARVVIVFGPAGVVSGVFVYEQGTVPGPGNPPTAGITESATDPYGNPVPGSGNGAEMFVQQPGGDGFAIITAAGAGGGPPSISFTTQLPVENPVDGAAGLFEFIINPGAANEQLAFQVSGPELVAPNDQFVVMYMESSADDGSQTAFGNLTYGDDTTGQQYTELVWGNLGVFINSSPSITGQKPGVTIPTPDTFHTMAPLGTGFNITGDNFNGDPCYAEYTFEPMGPKGSVHIRVNANVTAGPSNAFKLLTGTSLPTGYHPTQPRYFQVSFNEAAVIAGSNNAMGIGVLEASGAIFVYGGSGVAADSALVFEVTIRLD